MVKMHRSCVFVSDVAYHLQYSACASPTCILHSGARLLALGTDFHWDQQIAVRYLPPQRPFVQIRQNLKDSYGETTSIPFVYQYGV